MTGRSLGFGFLLGSVLFAVGCKDDSDSGPNLDPTPVKSESFSPAKGTREDGKPAGELWWRYQVNRGDPVTVEEDGMTMTLDFDEMLYVLDPTAKTREASLKGRLSGSGGGESISGSYSVTMDDDLVDGDTTLVRNSEIVMTMAMSAQGQSMRMTMEINQLFDPAWPWFLDRPDLDTLEDGYSETINIDGRVTGSLTMVVGGESQSTPIDENGSSVDTWTILEHQDEVTVSAGTYQDIVKVQRDTVQPDLTGSGSSEPTTYVYDCARGVGFIRSEGIVNIYGQPLTLELVETNMVQ